MRQELDKQKKLELISSMKQDLRDQQFGSYSICEAYQEVCYDYVEEDDMKDFSELYDALKKRAIEVGQEKDGWWSYYLWPKDERNVRLRFLDDLEKQLTGFTHE